MLAARKYPGSFKSCLPKTLKQESTLESHFYDWLFNTGLWVGNMFVLELNVSRVLFSALHNVMSKQSITGLKHVWVLHLYLIQMFETTVAYTCNRFRKLCFLFPGLVDIWRWIWNCEDKDIVLSQVHFDVDISVWPVNSENDWMYLFTAAEACRVDLISFVASRFV